ncbi:hypothetical protein A3Q56_02853 [Intoshia linei]|uniref:DNA mismatch repair protein S5 domain-containing protein n=1 Tax=Intoshia linei TaxID=1819745 RepID=A0A177B6T0_9BILA|nr:hypothetical protein A3Q56_02853 [Intoshia linei]
MKFLQISDNGCGINKDDLSLVCERFATSKLEKFSDLDKITTYGFRGEALASISLIASTLKIKTKCKTDKDVGYTCQYHNGKLLSKPMPCAANLGTTITIEGLFKNMSVRHKALSKRENIEVTNICQVVYRYAIENSNIAFNLKNLDKSNNLLNTKLNSSCLDNICHIYGITSEKSLYFCEIEDENFKLNGYVSVQKVRFHEFIIFINSRLVECARLKRIIKKVYELSTLKNSGFLIYLSLHLDPSHVDVNVHPAKSDVIFLNQEDIFYKISEKIKEMINNSNQIAVNDDSFMNVSKKSFTRDIPSTYQYDKVRSDFRDQKIENLSFKKDLNPYFTNNIDKEINDNELNLNSVKEMKNNFLDNVDPFTTKILKEHIYIGLLSQNHLLIQHNTDLISMDINYICQEVLYQVCIFHFATFKFIKLQKNFDIEKLIRLALDSNECDWNNEDGDKSELAVNGAKILIAHQSLLADYFSITITKDKFIQTLPNLIPGLVPKLIYLPIFLLALACQVNWEIEKDCIDTIIKELVSFYSKDISKHNNEKMERKIVEHSLLKQARKSKFRLAKIGAYVNDRCMKKIGSNHDFYKIFERC